MATQRELGDGGFECTVESLEFMTADDVCDWLKKRSGKPFEDSVLTAILENDLDGEALISALGQGPHCLKEAIPSLSKRLKLIGAIQVLRASFTTSSQQTPMPSVTGLSSIGFSDKDSLESSSPESTSKAGTSNTAMKTGMAKRLPLGANHAKLQSSSCMEFNLPAFRPETQKNLEAGRISDRDRCYIVRTLSTMLLSSNPSPSLRDCCVPAKTLVNAYSFLADASDDSNEPYYSWAKFISQRCTNVNRHDGSDGDTPNAKKRKMSKNVGKHQYIEDIDLIIVNDATAFNRVMKRMSIELSRPHPSMEVLEDLMVQTFSNRRASILAGEFGVVDICEKYPLLRKPKYVSLEFDKITGTTNSLDKFMDEWNNVWIDAIMVVAKGEGYQMLSLDDDEMMTDLVSIEAFKLLLKITAPKKKKGDALSHVMMSVKSGTPHDEIIGISNQPTIVRLYDIDNNTNNSYYIMIEQELLQQSTSFVESLFMLLAVHYVFNLQYDTIARGCLCFLQELVCKVKDGKVKHTAVYTAITSRLYRASMEIIAQKTSGSGSL